jgi:type IV pilus assembly protein PilX
MRIPVSRSPVKSRQHGVVLLIALIALVAMTLAAIGLVRSIDTGTMVAGNIGFRQSAVATADAGIETARTWIVSQLNLPTLNGDLPARGYYSTRQDNLDITGNRTSGGTDGVDWGGSDPSQPVKAFDAGLLDATGAHVYYLINRMCTRPGAYNVSSQDCAVSYGAGQGSTQRTVDTPDQPVFGVPYYFYRITVRVDGPKNTSSYVQALVLQ